MKPQFSKTLGAALTAVLVFLSGKALAQKTLSTIQERANAIAAQMQITEEPVKLSVGVEVVAVTQTQLSAGLDPANEFNAWAKPYADLPVYELTIYGRNSISYTNNVAQIPADVPVHIVLLSEDPKELDSCREMATSLISRPPNAFFGPQQKPLLFFANTDKAYVKSIYNPWKAVVATISLKPKSADAAPGYVRCSIWGRDIYGLP